MRRGACAVLCCLTFAFGAAGQGSTTVCKDLSYQDRNQTDYGPLRVAVVRGSTKDSLGGAIPKACVGVFTETDHKLIAATETDDNGHFELKDIRAGDYRLVAKYEGFSPANAKLRIERSRNKKVLAVQMRPAGLDAGSFVELR
jgi:Carboxypeptidase regulatory-like domain